MERASLETGRSQVRRQHPIGPYILDFYCDAAKLAIEVDGAAHDVIEIAMRDRVRDAWLGARGVAVLRFPAIEIGHNLDAVVDAAIQTALSRCPLRPLRGHLPQTGEESGPSGRSRTQPPSP